jgi:hypothetical protein
MNNTQWIYISKSSEDIQCYMNLQEALMHVAGDDNFITQAIASRYSKLR